ncbi:MAG: 5-oxoprolinase subunit PxpB [Tahibacter sp.]
MNRLDDVSIEALGDGVLMLQFGERIDTQINAQVYAAAQQLQRAALPGIRDIVPAYASLAVHYDALQWADASGANAAQRCEDALRAALSVEADVQRDDASALIVVPVCYGGEFGPDLAALAAHTGLSEADVMARHCDATYRVAMLGFAPGFAYLLGLDVALHAPRRAQPRLRVPAGSVAIGGAQTGIYPRELPGGWNLIGRTPWTMFDVRRSPASKLAPGDRVRFRVVDNDEYRALCIAEGS